MTVAAPVTISPPANTPLTDVCRFSSTRISPCLPTFKPGVVFAMIGFGIVPIATIA